MIARHRPCNTGGHFLAQGESNLPLNPLHQGRSSVGFSLGMMVVISAGWLTSEQATSPFPTSVLGLTGSNLRPIQPPGQFNIPMDFVVGIPWCITPTICGNYDSGTVASSLDWVIRKPIIYPSRFILPHCFNGSVHLKHFVSGFNPYCLLSYGEG